MILENLHLEGAKDTTKLVADLTSDYFGKTTIWAEIDKKYENALNDQSYDGFLVGLLYPAMYIGEDIYIKGAVSKKLFRNIQNYLTAFILTYTPTCKKIKITADKFITTLEGKQNHIGTGYSAGVDSLCTIYDHFEKEDDPKEKLDTLLFLNTGSHGEYSKSSTENKFKARYEYLKKSAPLPFIWLNTNIHKFHEIFPDSHQKTVTFTNTAGILIMEKYFSKYYIASSMAYKESIYFGKHRLNSSTEAFDSIILPLLSTENLEFIADGQQYTRSQKIARICDYDLAKKALNVCVSIKQNTAKNCSYCPKCLRTLMTLDSIGKLEYFYAVFDIEVYKKHIFKYKCEQRVLYYINPFAKDNIDLARKNGKYVPNLLLSGIVLLPKILKHIYKKIKK